MLLVGRHNQSNKILRESGGLQELELRHEGGGGGAIPKKMENGAVAFPTVYTGIRERIPVK